VQITDSRSDRGQASSDYVGLLALIGVAFTVAVVAISPPPLATSIASAMRHALCTVGGGVCTPSEASRAGLTPCVVHARSDAESVEAAIAVVRLRRGDTAVVERRSDGTATVSFLDANAVGAQIGVGFSLASIGGEGTAGAGAGVSFNTGRSYEFPSWEAARRFLVRHAREEDTTGEGLNLARRVSPLHEPHRLPAAGSSSFEAGTWAELEADAKMALPALRSKPTADASAAASRLLGRRRSGRRTTWFLRIENGAAAKLGLVVGSVGGGAQTDVVLEVTTENGRAIAATATGVAAVAGEVNLYGHSSDLGTLAKRLGRAGGGATGAGRGGMTMQASVELDLTVPENAAAVGGALDVLRLRAAPREFSSRLAALGKRLGADGRLEVAFYRSASSAKAKSARLAFGAEIGVEHVRSRETRELVAAWSAHGDALREREDCLAVTAS
jgi:hypothetical protein